MLNVGLHFPRTADDHYKFEPPSTSAARKVVALGDALNPGVSEPKKVAMKLHLNWVQASGHHLERAPVDAGGDTQGLI